MPLQLRNLTNQHIYLKQSSTDEKRETLEFGTRYYRPYEHQSLSEKETYLWLQNKVLEKVLKEIKMKEI